MQGDFSFEATYQDGMRDKLGQSFHTAPNGEIIDCGFWNGGFLTKAGTVSLEAYGGDVLVGTFSLGIY